MRELIPVDERNLPRTPAVVALEADAPTPSELFAFMAEAEFRFESLRMRIRDRTWTAVGESAEILEVALRHPGHARVVRRRDESGLSRDYDVWVCDGALVRTYDARSGSGSARPLRPRVVGATSPHLPSHARVWLPRTELPPKTLAEAFIHPRGLCRNVLATGPVTLLGGARLAGDRESILLRSDHPRTSHVLTDRPDRWLEVGVDRMTGLVLLLVEHVGDQVTRHAEVTDLELDPLLPDEAFTIHISSDTRMLY
jgi:hypothetical protein